MITGRCVDLRGPKHTAAKIEEQHVFGDAKGSGHTRIWLEDECLAFSLKDDRLLARGLQRELPRMKETKDADTNILCDCAGIRDEREEQEKDNSGQHAVIPPNGGAFAPR